ncbi:hypothetical protein VNO77_17092 [Canavalia gladiata]|uniref:Uncharacterized protein n=1 Tax=Canavalia gladiata TaxID=3824 RepID=A0AAN9LN82_CANGL
MYGLDSASSNLCGMTALSPVFILVTEQPASHCVTGYFVEPMKPRPKLLKEKSESSDKGWWFLLWNSVVTLSVVLVIVAFGF